MGRRTLVVVPRSDDGFDCRYAHWGVGVAPIAQSTPLGSDWSAAAVFDELDAGYDRLFVGTAEPSRYCVCWLDVTLADPDDVVVARTDDPDGLAAAWTEAKSRAVDAVAAGAAPDTARGALCEDLGRRADAVHHDASFLRDAR